MRMESDIGNADRAPCEQARNSRQVQEPSKRVGSTAGAAAQVCDERKKRREQDTPVRHTALRAIQKHLRSLLVLG